MAQVKPMEKVRSGYTPIDQNYNGFYAGVHGVNVKAHACGKTILVGEHAVVYGAEAVALPVTNIKLEIDIRCSIPDQGYIIQNKKTSETMNKVIEEAFTLLGIPLHTVDLKCSSEILIGAGLGSSAALCVALLRGLSNLFKLPLACQEVVRLATHLECYFHGRSSGLDTAVVAMEKIISFIRGIKTEALNIHHSLHGRLKFVLIDSTARASTAAMIQQAAPYFRGIEGEKHIQRFSDAAKQTRYALENGILSDIAEAMQLAARWLADAKVVTHHLSGMISSLNSDIGVLAAKPTGAGGGGYILALLDPERPEQLSDIKKMFSPNRVLEVGLSS